MVGIIEMGGYRSPRALAYIAQVLGESVAEPLTCFAYVGLITPLTGNSVDKIAGLACETILNDERSFWKGYSTGLNHMSAGITATAATLDGAKMTLDVGL